MSTEDRKMSQEDFDRLRRSGCPWRPIKLENVVVRVLADYDRPIDEEEGAFHPDGGCGCVVMDDDYICGIRCDHLIWMTGWHEYHNRHQSRKFDKVKNWDNRPGSDDYDCLLLVGNHKGIVEMRLVLEKYDNTPKTYLETLSASRSV